MGGMNNEANSSHNHRHRGAGKHCGADLPVSKMENVMK